MTNGATVAVHRALEGGADIAEEVPAICDLPSNWCTLAHRVSVGAGPITGDSLNPGVLPQSSRERGGFPIRE
jgi:hypothetical protein